MEINVFTIILMIMLFGLLAVSTIGIIALFISVIIDSFRW